MEKLFLERYQEVAKFVTSPETLPPAMRQASNKCLFETYIKMHEKLGTDLSLEIGAYEASYSLKIKEMYADAIAVCAIEGSPKTYQRFSKENDFKAK